MFFQHALTSRRSRSEHAPLGQRMTEGEAGREREEKEGETDEGNWGVGEGRERGRDWEMGGGGGEMRESFRRGEKRKR